MNHVTVIGSVAYRPVPIARKGRKGVTFAMYDVFGTDDDDRESRSAGWLPVVCWDELAAVSANLAPGDLLAVAGKLVPHHYIGNLLLCRSLEVHASEVRILTHRLFLITRKDGRPDNPPEGEPHDNSPDGEPPGK